MSIACPYNFSAWYGYDQDCSITTDFQSSSAGTINFQDYVCLKTTSYTYSHSGSGTYPAAGDTVYDENDNPLASGYYKIMGTTNVYRIIIGNVASGWPQSIC